MIDPAEDPRTPHRIRIDLARKILGQRYPGCHVQRVVILNEGRRVEATVILEGGQTINITVPEVEEAWH